MENEKNLVPTVGNAVANVPTLEQRVLKIQFHLQSMGQSAIIIGQELIECKKEVPQGEWLDWLKKNFNLKQRSAYNFMQIAERFGKLQTSATFSQSQMVEMLLLPVEDTENFIAEKTAKGTPVEDMTVKKLREEIKNWKQKVEDLSVKNDDLQKKVDRHDEITDSNARAYRELQDAYEELRHQKVIEVIPPDYEYNKRNLFKLQHKVAELQEQLNNSTIEIDPEDNLDDDDMENPFFNAQEYLEKLKPEEATSQALSQFFIMTTFLHEHKLVLSKVLNNYKEFSRLISKNVNEIADISSVLKNFLSDIHK